MNGMAYYYNYKYKDLNSMMAVCDYVVSLEENSDIVIQIVQEFVEEAGKVQGNNPLRNQFKVWAMDDTANQFLEFGSVADYAVGVAPDEAFYQFRADQSELGQIALSDVTGRPGADLQRRLAHLKALDIPE